LFFRGFSYEATDFEHLREMDMQMREQQEMQGYSGSGSVQGYPPDVSECPIVSDDFMDGMDRTSTSSHSSGSSNMSGLNLSGRSLGAGPRVLRGGGGPPPPPPPPPPAGGRAPGAGGPPRRAPPPRAAPCHGLACLRQGLRATSPGPPLSWASSSFYPRIPQPRAMA
jgi:hypothetical protein